MVTRLAEDVWWYDLRGTNAYLVDDDGTLTLVDAGLPWWTDEIRRGLERVAGSPMDLDRILLTHFDLDHVGGLSALEDTGATIYVGKHDADYLTGLDAPSLISRKGAVQRLTNVVSQPPELAVERVADGFEIGSFTVFETPGHTSGHVAYVSEDLGAGFLGDLVQEADGELQASPWYLSEDRTQVMESVISLAERAPPFEILGMGHGEPLASDGSKRLFDLADRL
jgi:glyoxylase-like metal-dependent hydrolase (beta-lactamase superfamily II)